MDSHTNASTQSPSSPSSKEKSSSHDTHEHAHPELSWWRKYWFSTDHKTIGIQYFFTAMFFLLFGFILMLLMRWQLAYPGQPLTFERFSQNITISVGNGTGYVWAWLNGQSESFQKKSFPQPGAKTKEDKAYDQFKLTIRNVLLPADSLQNPSQLLGATQEGLQKLQELQQQEASSALPVLRKFLQDTTPLIQRYTKAIQAPAAALIETKSAFENLPSSTPETRTPTYHQVALSYAKAQRAVNSIYEKFSYEYGLTQWAPIPWAQKFFGHVKMPGGVMAPDFYNSLGAMHGTIMVFLAVVPLGFAAFGNFAMPLQIGAPDMCFPRLNMLSYHFFFWGGIVGFLSFFVPGGAAKSGWTSYTPLSEIADQPANFPSWEQWFPTALTGQSLWLIALIILITSSLLGSVNFIATIIQLRCKGMSWMRLPFFVWAQFVTAFLLLLAFPPLEAAGIMQLMDRLADTSFFVPTGLVVNGMPQDQYSGGGAPLLWQHLFWFLGHPEVYVLLLPSIGAVAEIIACNTRKPLWGYRSMVFSVLILGFLSFIVWAHHMYLTGMGTVVSTFFQATTTIISIPSVIIVTALLISLWGGSIRFNTPMLFATAFLPMFGIGGLTGIPLAFNAVDLYLHDTYYVIAHFHYIVAPGIMFGLFAATYHWFPKATGRQMNEFWGKVHFWPSFVCMNLIFMPMFFQGMAGMHRRWYDGGTGWDLAKDVVAWNQVISISALILLVAQIPFIINLFYSIWYGKKVSNNPWHATTVEWSSPSPAGHGNFEKPPLVDKGPYEYSVPGLQEDYNPQNTQVALPQGGQRFSS